MTITIIHGPPASGKTFHRTAFMKKFGCVRYVDNWLPDQHELPDDGRLVLTFAGPEQIARAIRLDRPSADVRVIDIQTARRLIGVDPLPPSRTGKFERTAP